MRRKAVERIQCPRDKGERAPKTFVQVATIGSTNCDLLEKLLRWVSVTLDKNDERKNATKFQFHTGRSFSIAAVPGVIKLMRR
jgi:hypothetical protein